MAAVLGVVLAIGAGSALRWRDWGGDQVNRGTVTIAVYPWVGYEATAAVVSTILETRLGYSVTLRRLTAPESWAEIESGGIDVILENWDHAEQKREYIDDRGLAALAGENGNIGAVGWYVPVWMTQEYPGILDWRNLNQYSSLFATDESGGRGVLLESDESYLTNDAALIQNLGLNLTLAYAGSEAATVEAARAASDSRQPLLFYFWEPHFLFEKSRYARISLPERTPGCDADPAEVACDYPVENLDKIVTREFEESGGTAYQFIRDFYWTNADQNEVARYIAEENATYHKAATDWMYAHPEVWQPWLGL